MWCSYSSWPGCWFPGKAGNMEIWLPLSDRFEPSAIPYRQGSGSLASSFAEADAQPPIVLYEDIDHGSTVHRRLRNMRRSSPGQLSIRRSFGVGCLCFELVNLAFFLKTVDSMRLSGWLSPGLLKIILTVVPCLTCDGPDRMHPNCIFGDRSRQPSPLDTITDLTAACSSFWCCPHSPRMERGCSE